MAHPIRHRSLSHLISAGDRRILKDVKANATKDGVFIVQYKYGKGLDFGRVYTGGRGYQACSKEIRKQCAAFFYDDDDMVNSHPTILNIVFKQAGLSTPTSPPTSPSESKS